MKKRVNKTRRGFAVVFAAMLALVVATASPALARRDVSAGQAGDPGDGEEIFSGGSSSETLPTDSNGVGGLERDFEMVLLIPLLVPGLYAFQVIFVAMKLGARSR